MDLLALEIKNGNELAFRDFFDRTYPRVYAYLVKVFDESNVHLDDIAQEVYVKIWQNRALIDEHQYLEGYLFKVLRNTVISHFRKVAQDKKRSSTYFFSVKDTDDTNRHIDAFASIHEKEYNLYYERVMQGITPLKQQCFRLHRELGLTYNQISEREGIAIKTVEKYIRETSRILQSKLLPKILRVIIYIILIIK
jgi:RNA polymerase sigma-70 factor (ECF subfamily)